MSDDVNAIIAERDSLILEVEKLRVKCQELEEKLNAPTPCVRCGRENTKSPLKVKEDVLQRYFRSMLGQVPFTHTFYTLGGKLSATLTMNRGDVLSAHYNSKDGVNSNVMLVTTLSSVRVIDPETDLTKAIYEASTDDLVKAVDNAEERYNILLKSLDVVQLAFVRAACDAFVILVNQLIETVSSEDFYEGAGLL
jgi:hypothetical protein